MLKVVQLEQQSSNQRQLSEIVKEATAIRSSLIEPKHYDKSPVEYDPSNPYFQFRAIGYCALSQHKDSDGIVAFVLRQSADSLSAVQEQQKLIDSIRPVQSGNFSFNVLRGNPTTPNPDIHAHIINIFC
uniref:Uncharacterized protein n=1 Tax=Panagrolaimus sp. PS1159 TaxID=55785 RepID=A0AC35EWZ1_9BILA